MRNYPTNKIMYKHFDEIWSMDLADVTDYKTSKKKKLDIYLLFVIIDKISEQFGTIPPLKKIVKQ